jgi:hypothetical protein
MGRGDCLAPHPGEDRIVTMRRWADLLATVDEYRDATGAKCKRQIKAGVLMKDDRSGALAVKIDALPVSPTWSGWLAVRNVDQTEQEEQPPCQD